MAITQEDGALLYDDVIISREDGGLFYEDSALLYKDGAFLFLKTESNSYYLEKFEFIAVKLSLRKIGGIPNDHLHIKKHHNKKTPSNIKAPSFKIKHHFHIIKHHLL